MRSLYVPGSPSVALQATNFVGHGSLAMLAHLMPTGKPAPPRPRSPDFFTSAITATRGLTGFHPCSLSQRGFLGISALCQRTHSSAMKAATATPNRSTDTQRQGSVNAEKVQRHVATYWHEATSDIQEAKRVDRSSRAAAIVFPFFAQFDVEQKLIAADASYIQNITGKNEALLKTQHYFLHPGFARGCRMHGTCGSSSRCTGCAGNGGEGRGESDADRVARDRYRGSIFDCFGGIASCRNCERGALQAGTVREEGR